MVILLLERIIFLLNTFPSDTKISSTMSPSTIIEGFPRPDSSKTHIAFGTYTMVHTGTINSMKARDIPAIGLKPLKDLGGYNIVSLISMKKYVA